MYLQCRSNDLSRESAFTNVTKKTLDTNLVHKGDCKLQLSNTLRALCTCSSPITTIFELAQGVTHAVDIDKCSEAQFKSGVNLGCKKTWLSGTSDYQSDLETNNHWQLIRSFYYWERGDGTGGGGGECRVGQLA